MSKDIQLGDYVTISLPGEDFKIYSIKTISAENINISSINDAKEQILLIPGSDGWNVGGTSIIYEVKFIPRDELSNLLLTHNKNKDIEILAHMHDEELKLFCELSDYARDLCNDDFLWEQKIKKFIENRKNGDEDDKLKEYISDNYDFKDIYKKLNSYYDVHVWTPYLHNSDLKKSTVLGVFKSEREASISIVKDVWKKNEEIQEIQEKLFNELKNIVLMGLDNFHTMKRMKEWLYSWREKEAGLKYKNYHGRVYTFDELVEFIEADGGFDDIIKNEGYSYEFEDQVVK